MKVICKIPQTILMLGPAGCGKDTQADKLVDNCGFQKISTGEILRDEYEKKTPAGLEAFEYWGKGNLVPDEMLYRVFAEALKKYDSQKGWVFSGVVRTVPQIAMFDEVLEKLGRNLEKVILFNLTEEEAVERISLRRVCPVCKKNYHLKYIVPKKDGICDTDGAKLEIRDDDKPELVKIRHQDFQKAVGPIKQQYADRGILLEIDAAPSIPEIHEEIMKQLGASTENAE